MNAVELALQGDEAAEFRCAGRLLARYTAAPAVPDNESPRPVLHPVYTFGGKIVTDFRPSDHPWHQGIGWAFTYVDGDTFWGGPTFVREIGDYRWLANHGRQRHVAWTAAGPATLRHEVEWISSRSETLLRETRSLAATVTDGSVWRLEFDSAFLNATPRALRLSSPVCEGRPEGGYFGLMWRGAAAWASGAVSAPGHDGASLMGVSAPSLTYRARTGESLVFSDHPENPRFPTTWFERHAEQPLVSFALAYREPWRLAAGARLRLRYALELHDA